MKTQVLIAFILALVVLIGCVQEKEASNVKINIVNETKQETVQENIDESVVNKEENVQNNIPEKIIVIQAFRYYPETVTVIPGTKITWINKDSINHSVVSTSGPEKFDSGEILPGSSYSKVFDGEGVFEYRCEDHKEMRGKISVQERSLDAKVIIN